MRAEVYSKDQCPNCIEALALLRSFNAQTKIYKVVEHVNTRDISIDYEQVTRDKLFTRIPTARSVPQIFLNDEYIGGLRELKQKLAKDETCSC